MITIDLTQEEQAVLINLLETCIDDLHDEITHTDRLDYKEGLKQRKTVLMKLVKMLHQPQEAAGG